MIYLPRDTLTGKLPVQMRPLDEERTRDSLPGQGWEHRQPRGRARKSVRALLSFSLRSYRRRWPAPYSCFRPLGRNATVCWRQSSLRSNPCPRIGRCAYPKRVEAAALPQRFEPGAEDVFVFPDQVALTSWRWESAAPLRPTSAACELANRRTRPAAISWRSGFVLREMSARTEERWHSRTEIARYSVFHRAG